jgi:hypothetical protein
VDQYLLTLRLVVSSAISGRRLLEVTAVTTPFCMVGFVQAGLPPARVHLQRAWHALPALPREAAPKLLELTASAVVAAYDSPLGFRHGPKTIVNGGTLLIVLLSNDPHARSGDAAVDGDHPLIGRFADANNGVLAFAYVACAQPYALDR